MPKVDPETQNAVPPDIAARVASSRAEQEWGEVTRGPVIQCCDLNGKVVCYAFLFATGREPFPEHSQVLDDVRRWRKTCAEAIRGTGGFGIGSLDALRRLDEARRNRWGASRFGTITVSARYDLLPLREVMHGLHYLYSKWDPIREKAQEAVGSDATLLRIHYRTPLDQGYRFRGVNGEAVIDPFSLRVYSEDEVERRLSWTGALPVDEELAMVSREEWKALMRPSGAPHGDHFLEYHDGIEKTLLPCYLWTCGCAPTAAAMAMGYRDNYGMMEPGEYAKQSGHGRLIDYYIDEETLESYQGFDKVNFKWECEGGLARPRLILDLALAMGTRGDDGATHPWAVSPGINNVASEKDYGPGDWSLLHVANPGNDWLWELVTNEIGGNRPLIWALQGHTLCVWGYTDDRFVTTYNTWDEMRHDYHYRECSLIYTVRHTAGNPGHDIELESPDGGGEYTSCEELVVHWYQYGDAIDRADLYWSSEGGHDTSWTPFAQQVASHEGHNIYRWIAPNVDSRRVRVMVQGWQDVLTCYGADGSRENFSLESVMPFIKVQSPDGGECTIAGEQCDISWVGCTTGRVRIELFIDSSHAATIAPSAPNTGSYVWATPLDLATGWRYQVQVASLDNPAVQDFSDGPFSIARKIDIISPQAGEVCYIGEDYDVTWVPSGAGGDVEIDYSTDGGNSWVSVVSSEADDGLYTWRIPNTASINTRLKICHLTCQASLDTSDGSFDIWPMSVERLVRYSPHPPDSLVVGENCPNPVLGWASFEYYLPEGSEVRIDLHSVNGSRIMSLARGNEGVGWHRIDIDLSAIPQSRLPDGVYFCVVRADDLLRARKMVVCR
jgi:hypothetical protein